MKAEFSKPERKQLLAIARQSIAHYLEKGSIPVLPAQGEHISSIRGCFVSLKQEGALRGCIGNFIGDKPLYQLIQEMAVAAATKDPRFYPLARQELASLLIEISVLSPLQKINAIDEIIVGQHGIYLEKNIHRGVLLPQVATEHGWDRETFLGQTSLKAGLRDDAWKDNATIYIFSAEVFSEK